eukprot:502877-Prymnesium_polylepis.2
MVARMDVAGASPSRARPNVSQRTCPRPMRMASCHSAIAGQWRVAPKCARSLPIAAQAWLLCRVLYVRFDPSHAPTASQTVQFMTAAALC